MSNKEDQVKEEKGEGSKPNDGKMEEKGGIKVNDCWSTPEGSGGSCAERGLQTKCCSAFSSFINSKCSSF